MLDLSMDDIKYLKINYKDLHDTSHCVKAAIKEINEKEIFACAKIQDYIKIPVPQDIQLSLICEDGLYKTNTILRFAEEDNPFVFLSIQAPKDFKYQQNREYFRVKMVQDACIRFNDKKIKCKTCDISANGVKVVLKNKLDIPTIVKLDIQINNKPISTFANLIRTEEEIDKNNKIIYKASFSFMNMSEDDTNLISKACIQQQLDDKRQALL